MYTNDATGEAQIRQTVLDHTHTGEISSYELGTCPSYQYTHVGIAHSFIVDTLLNKLNEIFPGTATLECTDQELITDFSGEPYKILKPIPVTIRSLDGGGFEGAFIGGNIAWVGESRAETINGLKAEILDTIEIFEADEDRLGPEPKRQLAVLRTYLEHTS